MVIEWPKGRTSLCKTACRRPSRLAWLVYRLATSMATLTEWTGSSLTTPASMAVSTTSMEAADRTSSFGVRSYARQPLRLPGMSPAAVPCMETRILSTLQMTGTLASCQSTFRCCSSFCPASSPGSPYYNSLAAVQHAILTGLTYMTYRSCSEIVAEISS